MSSPTEPSRAAALGDALAARVARERLRNVFVRLGEPADPRAIAALIRAQMGREPAVAPAPEPVVTVRGDPGGTLAVQVRYADAETAETRTLDLPRPE